MKRRARPTRRESSKSERIAEKYSRPHAARLIARLAKKYRSPKAVQAFIRTFPYNREKGGETLTSAYDSVRKRHAHCLEASFIAAAILEHHGYPPLVMSLSSIDNLDHVIYVFQGPRGWGSIGRSRCEGLHGRAPVFKTLRALAWSYVDPFVDKTGRVNGYGVASLDDSQTQWRDSPRQVWKAEKYLIDLKHQKLKSSNARYKKALKEYLTGVGPKRQREWW